MFKILKANAGTGKSSKILGKAIDDPTRPYLVLAPFIKDCEAICGMYPSMIRQFGGSENRTREMNSHMMAMSFNTFGFGHYNDNVRAFLKDVLDRGVIIIDECDRMMEENVKGGHETYLKLFCGDKRWNVIGMSATPDKLIGGLEEVSNTPFEIHQLDNKSPKEHVKYFRVVGPSGKMVGYLGKNRAH